MSSTSTEKDSLSPSPHNRLNDDVKAEPIELVCNSHNLPSDDQSNDSTGDNDAKFLNSGDGKGSLRYLITNHHPFPFQIDFLLTNDDIFSFIFY